MSLQYQHNLKVLPKDSPWGIYWGVFIVVVLFLLPYVALANVVMNEIAWMGTENAATDEWVELYNAGISEVNLAGWALAADDGQPSIQLEGVVSPSGYFLLERSDDETVPSIAADFIYTGALSNSGEALKLLDNTGSVIDAVHAVDGWPAGDNTTKETMQRVASGWITAPATPKAENNSTGSEKNTNNDTSAPTDTGNDPSGGSETAYVSPELKPSIIAIAGENKTSVAGAIVQFQGEAYGYDGAPLDYTKIRFIWNFGDGMRQDGRNAIHSYTYPGVYMATMSVVSGQESKSDSLAVTIRENPVVISEVFPGNDGWIELFNPSAESVNIGFWFIQNSRRDTFSFPEGTVIEKHAYVVFSSTVTGVVFSNNTDASLLYPNKKQADNLRFSNITPQQSVFRINQSVGVGAPTPGAAPVVAPHTQESSKAVVEKNPQKQPEETVNNQHVAAVDLSAQDPPLKAQNYEMEDSKQQQLRAQVPKKNVVLLFLSIGGGALLGLAVLFLKNKLFPHFQ